jgi:alpha-beta hydrolase superfamily lysophospholipase
MVSAGDTALRGNGGDLFVRWWRPQGPPRAAVAICPGFNSHSGYYGWFGERCAAEGIACFAIDLRGRGKSDGERFYVETFDDYIADFALLVEHVRTATPSIPLFLLGHSAGGVVAALYALDQGGKIAGLVLESIAFELPAPDFALAVLKGLSHVAPHHHSLTLRNADFSRDPSLIETMNEDTLIRGESQPFATAAALVRADEQLRQSFAALQTPLLLIHGTADRASKPGGSRHLFEQAGSADKTLKLYEGRFHDPLNDLGREEVMTDIAQWIEARTS